GRRFLADGGADRQLPLRVRVASRRPQSREQVQVRGAGNGLRRASLAEWQRAETGRSGQAWPARVFGAAAAREARAAAEGRSQGGSRQAGDRGRTAAASAVAAESASCH